ncbi:phosphate-starvation-inducible PsiE family protein [Leptolyngbya sp. GGD]|uniref:phosphate-starvation-inducible PsiE family protein n=1 Tax=Leptolyngbya sp. GGD TaxID=2997907 RepID=UPI00227D28E5|nr:phosphate-starvation-inducible PsiE family protein [Leptolyngbya sp. GGD]MCY6494130.1 phosphate-starvation-inducible PsiE family protein [Leptolyngbya sp. GGD]
MRHPLLKSVREFMKDDNFLGLLGRVETWVSKILSIMMLLVIFLAVFQLGTFLFIKLSSPFPSEESGKILFTTFGLFLNVLIAFEILENITAYLKKHVIQVELVIVTSLIAVARKIIILDLEKTAGIDLIALATAIFALSISYWIVRNVAPKSNH